MKTMNVKISPLLVALSGVMLGISLAAADYHVDWKVALFLTFTVTSLYFYSGCSKSTQEASKTWSGIALALTIASGLAMLHFSFGTILLMEPLLLIVFGYMIIRAVRHTSFISRGKGILYVFVLFGLLAVYGSYYVCSHSFGSWPLIFPALSMGFISVAAKADDDKSAFRLIMNILGWACMASYAFLRMFDPWHFLFVLSLPVFFLKKPEWAVFAFAMLTGAGFLAFLV